MASEYIQRQIDSAYFLPYITDVTQEVLDSSLYKVSDSIKAKYQSINQKPARSKSVKKQYKYKPDKTRFRSADRIREEDPEIQMKKSKDVKILIKKLHQEKEERKRKLQELDEETRKKTQDEIEALEILQQKADEEQKNQKMLKLLQMKEKADKHRKELEDWKILTERDYRQVLSQKYLHEKLEESYITQVIMPELEKKKAELAQKRMMFQPMSRTELIDHAKKHDEILRDLQVRREKEAHSRSIDLQYRQISKSFHSKAQEILMEEERKAREDKEKEESERKKRLDKKSQYSELVKELYRPTVDELKKQEMQLLVEKLKFPVRPKLYSHNSAETYETISEETGFITEKHRPKKKYPKNPLVPEPPVKREFKKMDFLTDMRLARRSQDLKPKKIDIETEIYNYDPSNVKEAQKLIEKAEKVDKEIQRKERNLYAQFSNPRSLDVVEELNDMLIGSIRAKLAIVNAHAEL